ncbi:MAG: gamma-glutamyltransferase [Alphaproteobacteria bacterium]|jgi:gamma-glutamyltranspeptidase/glutathione hydrolase|nr:gamma-glutamyltransferase [Alphaproteobacteria bacterium]
MAAALAPAVLLVVLLGGCEVTQTLPKLSMFEPTSYFGGVVADEPRAALVAREVLAAGGSAADAAVALYFTLAVTYPSTASLGGGGLCLVYSPDEDEGDTTEVIEFYAQSAAPGSPPPARPNAIPGSARGMYALQARYGRLPWSQLLAPAETYARLGHQVSRALARDLRLAGISLFTDSEMRKIFLHPDGSPISEGQRVHQLELGSVLSQLRIKGAGDFYSGSVAKSLAGGASQAEGALTIEELRAFRPQWRESTSFSFGHHTFHTAPPPAAAGLTAAAIFHLLAEGDRYLDAPVGERAHLVAEVSKRAFADRQNWIDGNNAAALDLNRLQGSMATYRSDQSTSPDMLSPPPKRRLENPASTSFITMDRLGLTVSCAVTMNNLFGTGRVVPGTGILLATSPATLGNAATSLSPIVLVNHNTSQLFFAAGSAGGAAAPAALASVMRAALLEDMPLREAVQASRLHHGGMPDIVLTEPDIEAQEYESLDRRGHLVAEVPEIGRVNAVHCPGGVPRNPETCLFESDRRGYGLASGGIL